MHPDPLDRVDSALFTIARGALGASQDEYLVAIRQGLSSDDDLAHLLGHDKPDAVLRDYLRAVAARLSAP
jgi:hypothetical protein